MIPKFDNYGKVKSVSFNKTDIERIRRVSGMVDSLAALGVIRGVSLKDFLDKIDDNGVITTSDDNSSDEVETDQTEKTSKTETGTGAGTL